MAGLAWWRRLSVGGRGRAPVSLRAGLGAPLASGGVDLLYTACDLAARMSKKTVSSDAKFIDSIDFLHSWPENCCRLCAFIAVNPRKVLHGVIFFKMESICSPKLQSVLLSQPWP